MSPFKIALLVDHFLPRIGGIELQVRDLALELKKRGHQPHIITCTPGDTDLGDIPIHRLPVRLLPGFKILMHPRGLKLLENLLRKENFDVLHSHGSVVSPLAYGSLAVANRLNLPTLFTGHSLWEFSTPTFKILYQMFRGKHWNLTLSAVSSEVAKGMRKVTGAKGVEVIPNAIHPGDWKVAFRPQSQLNVTSVLRLNRKKRPQALLRIIPNILKHMPNSQKVIFNIIGKGPYEKRLRDLTRQLGVEQAVRFHGYLERSKIKEVFSGTDVFVHPTKKEALGIALIEARAAALPILALNYGGIKDIITDGVNGLLALNDRDMERKLLDLLSNASLRDQLRKESSKGIEVFSWDHVLDRILRLYRENLPRERKVS
jgi:glycosyltransferase involved in cell wall biosynthesis